MEQMRRDFEASMPECVAVLTPHGVYSKGKVTIGVSPIGRGELDGIAVEAVTDLDLAAAWAYQSSELGVPFDPVITAKDIPFPLDWGVTIPLSLLDPAAQLPIAVACPARDVDRARLVDVGSALAMAAGELDKRVALIVSADQGHGHHATGPYGFTPISAEYDEAMVDAVKSDDLNCLLDWDEAWIDAALADSYWQTLSLIGLREHVPMTGRFLSYEVDHYFGLLCASYQPLNPAKKSVSTR